MLFSPVAQRRRDQVGSHADPLKSYRAELRKKKNPYSLNVTGRYTVYVEEIVIIIYRESH